jgi:four helix bundle protein
MNKYANIDKDIHLRIKNFVVNCFVNIVRKIPKTSENMPIISQVAASLTSMGANNQEADAADSNRGFIAKYNIVRKETKETKYWLTTIAEAAILDSKIVEPYLKECQEILFIVIKIINNSKH